MEQELRNALDGFEAVWERVVNSRGAAEETPAPADGSAAELETLLQELNGLWEEYREFARRTAGEAQKRFSAMAEETRDSVRALQTEYFLRVGEVYHPAASSRWEPGVLTGMRRAYEAERRLAKRLAESGFSADTAENHIRALRDMIAGLLRA